jgi:hypothetical protein
MSTKPFCRDWKPRRNRGIYCSPACGGGCTHREFTDATRRAAKLAARLGDGWKPRVWENLGWHYTVELGDAKRGGISIHEGANGYWYLMGDAPSCGIPAWSHPTDREFRDPKDAVRYALRRAAKDVARQQATVDLVTAGCWHFL